MVYVHCYNLFLVYSLQVAEDTIVESPIGTVGATDADSGLAGTVSDVFSGHA